MAMWVLMVVCRTLVLAERMPPALAAWLPFLLLSAGSLWLWARHNWLRVRRRVTPKAPESVEPGIAA